MLPRLASALRERACYRADVDIFPQTWSALCAAVAALPDEAFDEPSGCRGWRVRDLVSHLIIDAQDLLITLSTPADTAPSHDALSYWTPSPIPPDGTAPGDALTVRLAAAYEDPALLRAHLDDLGAAAGRAALLAHPELPVATQGKTLTVRDYLGAYVLEAALHHLDLVAHLPSVHLAPDSLPPDSLPVVDLPPPESLAAAREMVERRLRVRLPMAWTDADALCVATGRRPATAEERAELDALGARGQMLPLSFG